MSTGRPRSKGKDWIGSSHLRKGALHRAPGIPEGERIPDAKLAEAEASTDPHLRRMAQLARTLRGLNRGSRHSKRGK
jgi:hypothetical protein